MPETSLYIKNDHVAGKTVVTIVTVTLAVIVGDTSLESDLIRPRAKFWDVTITSTMLCHAMYKIRVWFARGLA